MKVSTATAGSNGSSGAIIGTSNGASSGSGGSGSGSGSGGGSSGGANPEWTAKLQSLVFGSGTATSAANANQIRFLCELEFVELLANPFYLKCTSFCWWWG